MYDQYTLTALTEALGNTYHKEAGKGLRSINSFVIEWDIKVNKIKRVPIIVAPVGNGAQKCDVLFIFPENWYQMYDTFMIEETRQQFIVLQRPVKVAQNCWQVYAQIMDNDYDSVVKYPGATAESLVGCKTRFVTNWMPEMHKKV